MPTPEYRPKAPRIRKPQPVTEKELVACDVLAASREIIGLWFGYALLTTTGRDRVWDAMRRLRHAVELLEAMGDGR